mgnify:CR=1 FL=1
MQPFDPQHSAQRQTALATAVVAAVLAAVVAALMLYGLAGRRGAIDPAEQATAVALRAAIARHPDDQQLQEDYRRLDEQLRRDYFRHRALTATGAVLLAGFIAAALASARWAAALSRRLPRPEPLAAPVDRETAVFARARWAVGALGAIVVGLVVALVVFDRGRLPGGLPSASAGPPGDGSPVVGSPHGSDRGGAAPGTTTSPEPSAGGATTAGTATAGATSGASAPGSGDSPVPAPLGPPPSDEEIARSWPRFRGPGGLALSRYENVPTTWDAATGENIVWKSEVELPGNNSPVVWGSRVFLSGADESRRVVYCFDAADGKLLWHSDVPGTPESTAKVPEVMEDTGLAAPSVATDGRVVAAIFANGDLGAFDLEGHLRWSRSLGIPKNSYGHASSLLIHGDVLVVQFDQGNAKENLSKLFALRLSDGTTAWEVARPVPHSWTTPTVVRSGDREQLVTAASPWVIAYNPADGTELWRAKCLRQDVGPSPVAADGVVYVANEFPAASAIRADGSGDVTESHVLWSVEDGLPDTASPLATGEFLILLASYGMLTCYDAKTGGKLWEHEFDGNFSSSPSLVGDRLYVIDKEGKSYVLTISREKAEPLAEGSLGELCVTSPAFQDGRIYVRGEKHLFCIGKK